MLENGIISKAFVFAKKNTQATTTHQVKLNHFVNLIQTCGMSLTTDAILPKTMLRNDYGLYFIDLYYFDQSNPIPEQILQLAVHHPVVLFNCQHNFYCEKKALLAGVHGIFYCEDRADIILKGIEHLCQNGRWFKRETMNLALAELLNNAPNNKLIHKEELPRNSALFPSLTKREKTIINLVSSGAQNKEIAEQLHISPNTVKTHIYSIFRKTSSRNRIELISWTKQFSH